MAKAKDDGKVRTVAELLQKVKDLGDGDFIYRGQADSGWYLKSGAARRLSGNGELYPKNEEMSTYINELIGNARSLGLEFHGGGGAGCSDLKILAELQHYGAATNLLDFSKNILIALWMTCSEEPKKDGKIFAFDLLNDEVDPLKIGDLSKTEERVIDQLLNGDNILVWTPDNFVSRIQSQYSVFVIAPNESKITTKEIIIEAKAKKKLLIELETHFGISEIQVYPDLAGFARANRSTMPQATRDANYYIQWGRKYLKRSNFEAAKNYLGKAVRADAENPIAHFYEGYLYSEFGKRGEAIAAYDKAIELKPDYKAAYNNRGNLNDDLGKKKAALADYDKAIDLSPDSADVYNNRGVLKYSIDNFADALKDFDKAIVLKPDYATAYNNRGNVKKDMRDLPGALADYNKAIELSPAYADAYYNRGILKKEMSDLPGALADYDKAIEFKPNYAIAYNNRGNLNDDMGDKVAALADYDKAIEFKPNYVIAYNNRGTIKKDMGDLPGALADYNKAIESNPDYAAAYNNRGNLKKSMRDLPGALADYNKAIELDLDFADAYYNRGILKKEMGDKAGAEADRAKAAELEKQQKKGKK